MEKQSITQKHDMSCGFACLAFLTNKPYSELIDYFGEEKANFKGLHIKEIKDFLKTVNIEYSSCHANKVSNNQLYAEGTIVFIKRDKNYLYGHFLIRYQNRWMDPYINLSKESLDKATSGWRKRLPGKPQWVIYKK